MYEFYRDNPAASESLSAPIFEDKVVDFIIEMAQVGSRNVAPDELIGITAADPETDPKPAKKKRSTAKKPRKTATKTSEQDED